MSLIDDFINAAQSVGKDVENSPIVQGVEQTAAPIVNAVKSGNYSQVLPQEEQNFSQGIKQNPLVEMGNPNATQNQRNVAMMGVVSPEGGEAEAGADALPDIEQNGGKYVNENTEPLQGGTPAQIKARPASEVKFKYTPPSIETETPQAMQTAPSTDLPSISSEPEGSATLTPPKRPIQPNLTLNQKMAQKLNGLDNYQLPASYGENRPNLEAQDKSVMQNVIGGNTADQVLQKANAAKAKIWNQVETKAAQHTAISTNEQVLPYIKTRLDNLVNEGTITQAHANNALIGETNNLTQGGADIEGNASITGNQLVDLRKGANQQAPAKVPYGSTNPIPYVRKAIAQGYSDAMGNLDPDINNLYQQYGSVKRIGEMPDTFRNQNLEALKIPGINKGIPGSGMLRRGAASALNGSSAAKIVGGVGLLGGVGAAGYIGAKAQDKQTNAAGDNQTNPPQQDHNNSPVSNSGITQVGGNVNDKDYGMSVSQIPQSMQDVKLNGDGTINVAPPSMIKDASGKTIAMDQNSVNKQIEALNSSNASLQTDANSLDPVVAKRAQGQIAENNDQLASLNNLATSDKPLYDSYNKVKTVTGATSQALQMLNSSSPNISNLNGQIDTVQNSLDPAYAGLKQQLSGIQQQIAGGNLDVKTKGALQSVLEEINQQNAFDYYQAINTYASPTDTTTPQSTFSGGNASFAPAPSLPPITAPSNYSSITGGTNTAPSLPAIQ
jgi:hypothetical protein